MDTTCQKSPRKILIALPNSIKAESGIVLSLTSYWISGGPDLSVCVVFMKDTKTRSFNTPRGLLKLALCRRADLCRDISALRMITHHHMLRMQISNICQQILISFLPEVISPNGIVH